MIKQHDKTRSEKGYAGLMKRTFENPMVERFQKRKTRRMLVVLMLSWYIVVNFIAFSFPTTIWAWGLLFLGFFPLASMINMSVRGVTEIPIKALDDRQAHLKSQAYLHAYGFGITLAVVFGYFLAKLIADGLGLHSLPFFAGGAGILIGLPAMLLAWRLPDETDDGS